MVRWNAIHYPPRQPPSRRSLCPPSIHTIPIPRPFASARLVGPKRHNVGHQTCFTPVQGVAYPIIRKHVLEGPKACSSNGFFSSSTSPAWRYTDATCRRSGSRFPPVFFPKPPTGYPVPSESLVADLRILRRNARLSGSSKLHQTSRIRTRPQQKPTTNPVSSGTPVDASEPKGLDIACRRLPPPTRRPRHSTPPSFCHGSNSNPGPALFDPDPRDESHLVSTAEPSGASNDEFPAYINQEQATNHCARDRRTRLGSCVDSTTDCLCIHLDTHSGPFDPNT